jgi:hypothetical protein
LQIDILSICAVWGLQSLEKLLNPDDDMSAMYLALKEILAAAEKEPERHLKFAFL